MLLGTLVARLLGNMLPCKGFIKAGYRLILELILKCITKSIKKNELRFSGVYSRDNSPEKIKDGACETNLDKCSDIGTHWIAFYVLKDNVE